MANIKQDKKLINELKKYFTPEQIWTREDEDYNQTTKRDYLENENIICCIETEDFSRFNFDRLHYEENFWGSVKYNKILDKYKVGNEWYDSCITCIFRYE